MTDQRNTVYLVSPPLRHLYTYLTRRLAHKAVNLRINSTDDVSLGAWFTFSDSYFTSPTFNSSDISDALRTYPTILYLHGNAATRAFKTRVAIYSAFSSRLHVNVLAIDYRGFGDSTGAPTEEGTIQDATAAFDWLISHGADPKNVLVVGHSLGTAIGAQMTARLDRERGVRVRGVVLMSGFSSIHVAMETFVLFGIPILAPMRFIPGAWRKQTSLLLNVSMLILSQRYWSSWRRPSSSP